MSYPWSVAVQLHAVFLIFTVGFVAVSILRGASVARILWAWFLAATAVVLAVLVGIAQGLFMQFGLGAGMRYFAGELRPLALYGPWIIAGWLWSQTRARVRAWARTELRTPRTSLAIPTPSDSVDPRPPAPAVPWRPLLLSGARLYR